MAKGIVRGIAKHYGDPVQISEAACMHKGAPACHISVKMAAKTPTSKQMS